MAHNSGVKQTDPIIKEMLKENIQPKCVFKYLNDTSDGDSFKDQLSLVVREALMHNLDFVYYVMREEKESLTKECKITIIFYSIEHNDNEMLATVLTCLELAPSEGTV